MERLSTGFALIALALSSIAGPVHKHDNGHYLAILPNEPSGEFSVWNPNNMALQMYCRGRYVTSRQSSDKTEIVLYEIKKSKFSVPNSSAFYCLFHSNTTANYIPVFQDGQGVRLTIKPDGFYNGSHKISGYNMDGESFKIVFESWLQNWEHVDGKKKTNLSVPATKMVKKITDAPEDEFPKTAEEIAKAAEELAKKVKEAEKLARDAKEAEENGGAAIGLSVVVTVAALVFSL